MARYQYIVWTNPVKGREDEYNDWYDNVHVPDVLTVPGLVGATRSRLVESKAPSELSYMTVYQIETDDIDAVMADLKSRVGTERMTMSDALDRSTTDSHIYMVR